MRKKAIVVVIILAVVSAMTLANAAFAAQSNKPTKSPPGKAKAGSEPDENAQTENTETVQTCDGERIELSKEEKLTLDLHNETRKENELEELCVDPRLTKAARAHSADMLRKHYFGHNSPDGKTSGQRLKDLGYDWRATAENIAWGSGSASEPESRFDAWMKSEGHKENITNGRYEQVGIGIASGQLKEGGQEETVYTVEFGSEKKR